jgi:hypothetical protein
VKHLSVIACVLCCLRITHSLYNHVASLEAGPGAAQEARCSIQYGFRLEIEFQALHQHGKRSWLHPGGLLTQSRWIPDVGWVRWRNWNVIDG